MADIKQLTISYPDFKLNTVIQPDEFDTNNNEIVTKVNEVVTSYNNKFTSDETRISALEQYKTDSTNQIADRYTKAEVYTKTESDGKYREISDSYTKGEVDNKEWGTANYGDASITVDKLDPSILAGSSPIALSARIDSNDNDISALQSDMGIAKTDIANAKSDITQAKSDITANTNKIDSTKSDLESKINSVTSHSDNNWSNYYKINDQWELLSDTDYSKSSSRSFPIISNLASYRLIKIEYINCSLFSSNTLRATPYIRLSTSLTSYPSVNTTVTFIDNTNNSPTHYYANGYIRVATASVNTSSFNYSDSMFGAEFLIYNAPRSSRSGGQYYYGYPNLEYRLYTSESHGGMFYGVVNYPVLAPLQRFELSFNNPLFKFYTGRIRVTGVRY